MEDTYVNIHTELRNGSNFSTVFYSVIFLDVNDLLFWAIF